MVTRGHPDKGVSDTCHIKGVSEKGGIYSTQLIREFESCIPVGQGTCSYWTWRRHDCARKKRGKRDRHSRCSWDEIICVELATCPCPIQEVGMCLSRRLGFNWVFQASGGGQGNVYHLKAFHESNGRRVPNLHHYINETVVGEWENIINNITMYSVWSICTTESKLSHFKQLSHFKKRRWELVYLLSERR